MTTQYTPILKLALPVTGELSGTWGDVVNDNITSMIEQAIAGLATINTWSTNSHTLTTANGTSSESRCAMLVAETGSGGTAITGAGTIVCPAAAKLYVVQNNTSFTVTLNTAAGTGTAVAAGNTAFLFCDGTDVNPCVTTIVDGKVTGNLTVDGNATVNGNTTLGNATSDTITATARFASGLIPSADNTYDLGSASNSWKDLYVDGTIFGATLDLTNLEVTNIKAKDGTAAVTIADTTGVVSLAANPVLSGGTANGVAYLNGSKVLTTGSALTFDGTNLGIGTSSPTQRLHIQLPTGLTDGISLRSRTDGGGEFNLICADTSSATPLWKFQTGTSEDLAFLSGTSERMRLTSTGLGIGTSSPTNALSVSGNANITGNTTLGGASTDTVTVNGYMGVGALAATAAINVETSAMSGAGQRGVRGQVTFNSAATTSGYVFSSAPSTQAATFTLPDIVGFYAFNPSKGAGSTITNAHGLYIADQTQGTNNYGITSVVSSGSNKWNIYASGTAQNYFSGNVLVGDTTSTTSPLSAGSFITASSTTGSELILKNSSGIVTGELVGGVAFGNDDPSSGTPPHYSGIQARSIDSSGTMTLGFYTGLANYEANTPQVLIDASGNMGIGNTPSGTYKLEVTGGFSATGNAVLGDATTDTVTVNGYMGVGGAGVTSSGVLIQNTMSGATVQHGLQLSVTGNGGASVQINAITAKASSNASAYTVANLAQIRAANAGLGAGSTITNQHGIYIEDQTQGTNNYGITSLVSSGTNKWNFYASGTAANAFAGSVRVGGVTAPVATLDVTGNIRVAHNNSIEWGGTAYSIVGNATTGFLQFNTASTERMRLDSSGNLLIGTTSAASTQGAPLQVITAIAARRNIATVGGPAFRFEKSRATTDGTYTIVANGDTLGEQQFYGADGVQYIIGASVKAVVDGTPGTNDMPTALVLSTTADGASSVTERMRIDSSGNMGLGVTPSAWGTGYKAIDIAARTSLATGGSNEPLLVYNGYYNGTNWIYKATTSASYYQQIVGEHRWFNAASGTAGNAITFTQAMTLDASGYLGIGTTSPNQLLEIAGSGSAAAIRLKRTNSTAAIGSIEAVGSDDVVDASISLGVGVSAIAFSTAASERMRLDSSGNVGIGTSSPASLLHLNANNAAIRLSEAGTYYGSIQVDSAGGLTIASDPSNIAANSRLIFGVDGSERMRIDSSGNMQMQTGAVMPYAPAPASISTTATLTNANIQAQIINTTGTSYTVTMPLGTTMETLASWTTTNVAYDFYVINTASGTITMAVNTGVTSLGGLTIATGTSAQFRIRRTAANTFVLYRLG